MRTALGYVTGLAVCLTLGTSAWAEALPRAGSPEEVGLSSERLERIGDMLRAGVAAEEIPGAVVLVARHGKIAYFEAVGERDPSAGEAMAEDAIFRIYSMTKPITSVAAMMLVEEGRMTLSEPVTKYLPKLADLEVGVETPDPATGEMNFATVAADRAMTIHDLLRHTAGFTYGVFGKSEVKRLYGEHGVDESDITNAELIDRLAAVPLAVQPGKVWEYGRSTDVLGRVIEVVSGMTLAEFFAERIFEPLGMVDTAFYVPQDKHHRIAEPFAGTGEGVPLAYLDVTAPPTYLAGGQGLVSTVADYARFSQMLLNGGELDGVRLLGRKTVEFMTADHLDSLIETVPATYLPGPGHGFGLGFGVRLAAGEAAVPGSVGEFYWGGYAGTFFWVDPVEDLIAVYMMQSIENRQHYRQLFKSLVLQALDGDPAAKM